MTVSNMSIEWGARAGLIAPDETTFRYLEGRPGVQEPLERGRRALVALRHRRRRAPSTARSSSTPPRSRRRSPGARTPARPRRSPAVVPDAGQRGRAARARLHGAGGRRRRSRARPSTASSSARARTAAWATCARPPRSCAASASRPACGRWSCRARCRSRPQAEAEGLDRVFSDAGFEWRNAGCSMCLGMNPDVAGPRGARGLDLQPQLRGSPGPPRAHASDEPRDGRGRGHRRAASSTSGSSS